MVRDRDQEGVIATLQNYLIVALVISVFITVLAIGLNDLNHKYARASSSVIRNCKNELFILSVPDSQLCCDRPNNAVDWVCIASNDSLNKLFSSKWAFQIPVLPLVMTVLMELIFSMTSLDASFGSRLVSNSCRLIIYISIILYRTVCFIQKHCYSINFDSRKCNFIFGHLIMLDVVCTLCWRWLSPDCFPKISPPG